MEELLYIWAKEHPEFKYQQGMNEILAVVVVSLISELMENEEREDHETAMNSDDDSDDHACNAHRIFLTLHDPQFIWADAYLLFESVMNLGVKELYYK
jgi:hypothetical protein